MKLLVLIIVCVIGYVVWKKISRNKAYKQKVLKDVSSHGKTAFKIFRKYRGKFK
ncbi:hypothetical protein [Dongshaea marina]|uniref:hypothetical protein n=1 Tax=Dongshaea marina TaxID=2047966 RepID=UPI00131EF202|nr:hypothetical protein [Dongshaea marina]